MNIKEHLGSKTYYRTQAFQAGFGYEPSWQNMDASADYDEALVNYNEFKNLHCGVPLRLISETVSIDVLESNE